MQQESHDDERRNATGCDIALSKGNSSSGEEEIRSVQGCFPASAELHGGGRAQSPRVARRANAGENELLSSVPRRFRCDVSSRRELCIGPNATRGPDTRHILSGAQLVWR